jgi:hypothetical protein
MLGKIQLCGKGMELAQWTLSRRGVQMVMIATRRSQPTPLSTHPKTRKRQARPNSLCFGPSLIHDTRAHMFFFFRIRPYSQAL